MTPPLAITVLFLLVMGSNPCMSFLCPPKEDIHPCTCTESDMNPSVRCTGLTSLDQLKTAIAGLRGDDIGAVSNFVIEDSKLDFLPHDLFANLKSVSHVRILLCGNLTRIGNLGEDQFKGLENSLESLTITDSFSEKNPLTYLSLKHLKKLRDLDISKTYSEVLHNEWFKEGPTSLTSVRFHKGHIRNVGTRALQFLLGLKFIDLSDNKISYLPRSALPQPAQHLTELNLERNKLDTFPEDFFTDMPSLKTVNLELNDFSTIDEKIWTPVWSNLQDVNIDFNPLVCDSKIKWIYSLGEDLEKKLVAMCYKPFKLMERELHSLKPEELKETVNILSAN